MLVWDVEYINLPRITTFHSLRTKLNGELSALISAVQTPMHHAINDIASRQAKAWRNPLEKSKEPNSKHKPFDGEKCQSVDGSARGSGY